MAHGFFMRRDATLAAVVLALLTGCAAPRVEVPLLQLPPAALGRELNQQQQITVAVEGRAPQRLEVLLEADAQTVRLALMSLGHTAARLEWDGRALRQESATWWPAAIPSERVLSELQLVLWPVAALQAALPAGWTLEEGAQQRRLRWQGKPVIDIRYETPQRIELAHLRAGYRLLIEARDLKDEP